MNTPCRVCSGEGFISESVVCSHCCGSKELDWVEQIVGKKLNHIVSLPSNIRTLRIINYIHNTVESTLEQYLFEPPDDILWRTIEGVISDFFSALLSRKLVYEYVVLRGSSPVDISVQYKITPSLDVFTSMFHLNHRSENVLSK